MAKLPQVSGKKAVKVFVAIGYQVARQKGSHIRLRHSDSRRTPLTVPDHQVIGRGLLRRLLRDADLSPKDFMDLLKK